jgi:hypothetical protein
MGRECDTQRNKGECIQNFCETSWRKQIDEDVKNDTAMKAAWTEDIGLTRGIGVTPVSLRGS